MQKWHLISCQTLSKKKILVECCARKSHQSPSGKTEDQRLYPIQEIKAIPKTNKTTSTSFRYQKAVLVSMCHDVCDFSYDDHLYNRTRLNQSIESLSRNRKETTKCMLCEKKFKLNFVQEKVIRVLQVKQKTKDYILSKET